MTQKTDKLSALIEPWRGRAADAHYLGYFDCFNRQLYFEAHEVLEVLWLQQRKGPNDGFYKGLIQLAGAFVHLDKGRPGPAGKLLDLAEGNLRSYPDLHEQLDLRVVRDLIEIWRKRCDPSLVAEGGVENFSRPRLNLNDGVSVKDPTRGGVKV